MNSSTSMTVRRAALAAGLMLVCGAAAAGLVETVVGCKNLGVTVVASTRASTRTPGTQEQVLTLTNSTQQAVKLTVTALNLPTGISMSALPSTFSLAANETKTGAWATSTTSQPTPPTVTERKGVTTYAIFLSPCTAMRPAAP